MHRGDTCFYARSTGSKSVVPLTIRSVYSNVAVGIDKKGNAYAVPLNDQDNCLFLSEEEAKQSLKN